MTIIVEVRDKIGAIKIEDKGYTKEEIEGIAEEFALAILTDFCGYEGKKVNEKWKYREMVAPFEI
jgi:hypothetical protein